MGLLCVMVLSLWALAVAGVEALSLARAYTSVASTWSASQRDAGYHLMQYAASHNPADYAEFLHSVRQPAGARTAMVELASSDPNRAVARNALEETGVDPREVEEILRSAWIVRRLGLSREFLGRRIALDAELQEMRRLASMLHGQIMAPEPSPAHLNLVLGRINDAKHRMTELDAEFSARVDRVCRRVKAVALAVTGLTALAVLGLGALLTLELVKRIRLAEAGPAAADGEARSSAPGLSRPESGPPERRLAT